MAIYNTAGRTYDTQELNRINATLTEQQTEMDKIDNEKSVQTKKIVQYIIVLTGAVLSLFIFYRYINKK